MTLNYLLDTNILSESIKSVPNESVLGKLARHQHEICTAAPVWHELQFGCMRLPMSRKRTILEAFLLEVLKPGMVIFPYDEAAAVWHAKERARLSELGKTPSFTAGQIAAISKVNGLALVTRNTADFVHFSGLKLQNWFK